MHSSELNWHNLDHYLCVPIGYRFIDRIQLVSQTEALGFKAVSTQDWYFRIHFPGNPVMPGVFIMESIEQTAIAHLASMGSVCIVDSCSSMRIFSSVRPGDSLRTHVTISSETSDGFSIAGEAYIQDNQDENRLVCTMRFVLRDAAISREADSDGKSVSSELLKDHLDEILPIRPDHLDNLIADPLEYRFIDSAAAIPGKRSWGFKNVSSQEWYFPICCRDEICMPAAFLIEAIMQTGVLVVTTIHPGRFKLMMYNSCTTLQIYDSARPGDRVETYVELKRFRNGIANYHGIAYCADRLLCELHFILVAPDEMQQVRR